jgi:hypothetical protein
MKKKQRSRLVPTGGVSSSEDDDDVVSAEYIARMQKSGEYHMLELERADRRVRKELEEENSNFLTLGEASNVVRGSGGVDHREFVKGNQKERTLQDMLERRTAVPEEKNNDDNIDDIRMMVRDPNRNFIVSNDRSFIVPGEPLRTILPPVAPTGFFNADLEDRVQKKRSRQRKQQRSKCLKRRKRQRKVGDGGGRYGGGNKYVDKNGMYNENNGKGRYINRTNDVSNDDVDYEDENHVIKNKMNILLEIEETYKRTESTEIPVNWLESVGRLQ